MTDCFVASGNPALTITNDVDVAETLIRGNNDGSAAVIISGAGSTLRDVQVVLGGVQVTGTNNLIVGNRVSGATAPYNIAAGNAYGPIVDVSAAGDVSAIANADHPLANLAF